MAEQAVIGELVRFSDHVVPVNAVEPRHLDEDRGVLGIPARTGGDVPTVSASSHSSSIFATDTMVRVLAETATAPDRKCLARMVHCCRHGS